MNIEFIPSSSHVLFGNKDLGDNFYIPLIPADNKNNIFRIEEDFFLIPELALSLVLGSYNEYDDYTLSPQKWNKAMWVCKKIVNEKTFDAIFEYITDADYEKNILKNDALLYFINRNGKRIWDNIESYKLIISDLEKWTQLFCLNRDIDILGF